MLLSKGREQRKKKNLRYLTTYQTLMHFIGLYKMYTLLAVPSGLKLVPPPQSVMKDEGSTQSSVLTCFRHCCVWLLNKLLSFSVSLWLHCCCLVICGIWLLVAHYFYFIFLSLTWNEGTSVRLKFRHLPVSCFVTCVALHILFCCFVCFFYQWSNANFKIQL